jgi:NADP-dependent 3-hydroxy acid dehydrogenase YdfG
MKNFDHKKVVITGGGSGIGKSLIAELHKAGVKDFAVIGRNLEILKTLEEAFPEANFLLFGGDVSQAKDIREFVSICTKQDFFWSG